MIQGRSRERSVGRAGEMVAYLWCTDYRDRRITVLEYLFVDPRWRGRGFSRALLAAECRLADRRGYRLELAVVRSDDAEKLVGFYRLFGFEDDGWLYGLLEMSRRARAQAGRR